MENQPDARIDWIVYEGYGVIPKAAREAHPNARMHVWMDDPTVALDARVNVFRLARREVSRDLPSAWCFEMGEERAAGFLVPEIVGSNRLSV